MDAEVEEKTFAIASLKQNTVVTPEEANVYTDFCFVSVSIKKQEHDTNSIFLPSNIEDGATLEASELDKSPSTGNSQLNLHQPNDTREPVMEGTQVKLETTSPPSDALNYEECNFKGQSNIFVKAEEAQERDSLCSQSYAIVEGDEPPLKVIKKEPMLEDSANEEHEASVSPSSIIINENLNSSPKSHITPVGCDFDSIKLEINPPSQVAGHLNSHNSEVCVRSFKECETTGSKISEFSLESGSNVSEISVEKQEFCWIKEEPFFESHTETVSSETDSLDQAGSSRNVYEWSSEIQIGSWSGNEGNFETPTVTCRTLNDRNSEDQERTSSEDLPPGCTNNDPEKSSPSCPTVKSQSIHTQHSRAHLDETLNSRCHIGVEKFDSNGTEKQQSCPHCPEQKIAHSKNYLNGKPAEGVERCKNWGYSHCKKQLEKPSSCTQCAKIFYNAIDLGCYEKTHRQCYVCAHCSATFKYKVQLIKHIKQKHSDDNLFACEQCPFRFNTLTVLKSHLRKHKKRFSCPLCLTSFTRASNLKCHVTKHCKGRSYACPVCPKMFKTQDDVGKHLHEVHFEKVFSCTLCSLRLKTAESLRTHQMIHEAKKPTESSKCPENFRFHEILEQHSSTNPLRDIGHEETFHAPSPTSQTLECNVEGRTWTSIKKEHFAENDAISVSINECSSRANTISSNSNECSVESRNATSLNTVEGNLEVETVPSENTSDNNKSPEQHNFKSQERSGSRKASHGLSLTGEMQERTAESQAKTGESESSSRNVDGIVWVKKEGALMRNETGIVWFKTEGGLENDGMSRGSVNEFSLRNQAGISSNTNECSSENRESNISDTIAVSPETRIGSLPNDNSSKNSKESDLNVNEPCFKTQANTIFRLNEASIEKSDKHLNAGQFVFPQYSGSFNSKCPLNAHGKETLLPDPKRYVCDLCSARFKSLVGLRRHHINNTSEKPLSCPECPKTFMFKELLRLHLEKHVNAETGL